MKYYTSLLLLCLCTIASSSCSTAQPTDPLTLKFEEMNGEELDIIHYPPGTTFRIMEDGGPVDLGTLPEQGSYEFAGAYTLIIDPPYKRGTDNFKLNNRRVHIFTTHAATVAAGIRHNNYHDSPDENEVSEKPSEKKETYQHNVMASYEVNLSSIRPNRYNLDLTFTNGIHFSYMEGKARATLDGKELNIIGKYVIPTRMGTAKVSFNPDNGKVYYVFTPGEKLSSSK